MSSSRSRRAWIRVWTLTGTVSSSPVGIVCGATCAFSFAHNTVVTLTPAADATS